MDAIRPSIEEISLLNDRLEGSQPQEILRWAVETYQSTLHANLPSDLFSRPHFGLTMATAFGAEGCVLLSMLSEIEPYGRDVRVFNLDTGYQFQETLDLRERIKARYGIEVEYVRPRESVAEMERRFEGPIYDSRPDECCRIRKIVPMKEAIAGYDAWITAIRRDQTPDRARAHAVEWDSKFGLVKVNPLVNWTKRDVWTYILANDVPYNPLHDQGYPSIGCRPCTRAVGHNQDERAGRWSNFAKLECGLHSR